MCGICGLFRHGASASGDERADVARMSRALARRGPDGEGEWVSPDARVVLGHRRLAVLDLSSAGAQPMVSRDGRFAIVYNGEIYNFRELRGELAAAGVELRSASDTEVILELWRLHGERSLARLRGMYAFALWDGLVGELALVRDPYGIKPLYYSDRDGVFRFASQVKALEASAGVPLELDRTAVAGFLSWGAVPEPLTFRKAVRALPAGQLARLGADGRLRFALAPQPPGPEHAPDPVAALEESIDAHLVADVPVAIFLSAGIDSALVAACVRRRTPAPPVALTLTWDEVRGTSADEAPLARATAERLGLRHVESRISGPEVREALPAIVAAMDQPSIDGVNTWLVARLARREGFKVALSGLGGDELFGGYPSFREIPRWTKSVRRYGSLPGLAAIWSASARRFASERPKLSSAFRYGGSFSGAYVLRRGLFLPHEVDRLLAPLGSGNDGGERYDATVDAWESLTSGVLGDSTALLADPWRVVQRLESSIYLRNQLLRDADWAGMAHGVEIRVPFVDARLLAAFAAGGFEPARTLGKAELARRVAPELPGALFTRRKTGFQMPIEAWLSGREGGAERSVGDSSRRLALRILEQFGVDLAASGSGRVGQQPESTAR